MSDLWSGRGPWEEWSLISNIIIHYSMLGGTELVTLLSDLTYLSRVGVDREGEEEEEAEETGEDIREGTHGDQ